MKKNKADSPEETPEKRCNKSMNREAILTIELHKWAVLRKNFCQGVPEETPEAIRETSPKETSDQDFPVISTKPLTLNKGNAWQRVGNAYAGSV